MRGHSIHKWRINNRGAGKIESRRVLAGRGRNTLQGRTASKEPNVEHTRACDSIGTQQERDGIDLLSCVGCAGGGGGSRGCVSCVLMRFEM
ncbi:hypothetical protein Bca4012_050825 [Brassica carinata]